MWALWAEVVVLCSRAPGPPSAQLPLPGGVCSWQLPLWASPSACGLCTRLPALPWPHRAAWVCGNLVLHNGHRVWWMSAPVSGYLLPHSTPPPDSELKDSINPNWSLPVLGVRGWKQHRASTQWCLGLIGDDAKAQSDLMTQSGNHQRNCPVPILGQCWL